MNMRYGNVDGKIVVFDDEGNLTYRSDNDHCEEILISENLIETMTKEMKKLEFLQSENSNIIKKSLLKEIIKIFLSSVVLCTVVALIFQSLSFLWLSMFTVSLPLVVFEGISSYSLRKSKTRENNGINSQLDYLNQFLALEKENLVKLKGISNSKGLENEKVLVSTKLVNDKEKLQQMKLDLESYYEMGYNSKNNKVEDAIQYRK